MNLSDERDRLDAADGEPASYAEAVSIVAFIAMCVILAVAVTVAAIRLW